MLRCLLFLTLLILGAGSANAECPKIHGLIDLYCNHQEKFTFTGDSITYGLEDTVTPIEGYPGRLQELWPWSHVENLGIPGLTSWQLLSFFKQNLIKHPPGLTEQESRHADIYFVAVGVNDFWSRRSVSYTVTTIARLVNYLRNNLAKVDGKPPLMLVATLSPTLRNYQQPFVAAVNKLLLHYRHARNLPVWVRFDKLPVETEDLLNPDGLHPNGKGYTEMMEIVQSVITGKAQQLMAKLEATPTPSATETPTPTPTL